MTTRSNTSLATPSIRATLSALCVPSCGGVCIIRVREHADGPRCSAACASGTRATTSCMCTISWRSWRCRKSYGYKPLCHSKTTSSVQPSLSSPTRVFLGPRKSPWFAPSPFSYCSAPASPSPPRSTAPSLAGETCFLALPDGPCSEVYDRACASHPSDEKVVAYEAHFAAHKIEKDAASLTPLASSTIPVYFHVVSKDSTTAGGNVP